jgi:hypothetical protein
MQRILSITSQLFHPCEQCDVLIQFVVVIFQLAEFHIYIFQTALAINPAVSLPLSTQFLQEFCLKCLVLIVG